MINRLQVYSRRSSAHHRRVNETLRAPFWFPGRRAFLSLVWLAGWAFRPVPLNGDSLTLKTVADAEIRAASPAANLGTGPTMVCGTLGPTAGAEVRRAVLKFDLAGSIPPEAVVTGATLTIAVTRMPSTGLDGGPPADSNFTLHRLLHDWVETNVSWASPWDAPGASSETDIATNVSSQVFISGTNTYTFPPGSNLVADVKRWAQNPGTNFGWLLMSDAETAPKTARHVGSREGADVAPTLTVEYSTTSPPLAPRLTNLSLASGRFDFQFSAEAQHGYFVEFTTSLTPPDWQALTNFSAPPAGTNLQVTDPVAPGQRLYRVRTQ
jgi:hypothetical protein